MDALLLAEVDDLLLWQERVVFDLVGGGDDGGLGEELLEVLDGVVGHADGLDLLRVCLVQLLHVLPCVDVGDGAVEIAVAVFELGEEGVVSWKGQCGASYSSACTYP